MVLIKQYTKIPIKTGRENVFVEHIGSPAGAFANVRFAILITFTDSDARRTEAFKNSLKIMQINRIYKTLCSFWRFI